MVSIIVEDGSVVTGANSYVTTAQLQTYADNRNITISASDLSELIIQSMDYIESLVYKGYKLTRDQALQWPRSGVMVDGYYLDSDTIPQELKNGQMAAALAVDAGNSPLATLERGKKRVRVEGAVEVEYFTSYSANTVRTINSALWKLLDTSGGVNTFKVSKA